MAKKYKIASVRTNGSLERKQGNKTALPLVLIVCEGETEKLYFEGMKKELKLSSVCTTKSDGSAPISVVESAEKKYNKVSYEHVYCVFDRDAHTTFDEAREKIKILSTRKRNQLPIKEAISVVCFEIWILMHFEQTSKQFRDSSEIIHHIKDKRYITEYEKAASDLYNKTKGKLDNAIENAKLLARDAKVNNYNPYTQIHEMVEFLCKLAAQNLQS